MVPISCSLRIFFKARKCILLAVARNLCTLVLGHMSNGPMHDGISDGMAGPTGSSIGVDVWNCQHCTFENIGSNSSCEMCGLPRN